MSGRTVKLTAGLFLALVMVALTTAESSFSGGTIHFYCVDASNPNSYRFHFTVITGWVLGHGPCGPGCSVTDVGKQTRARRDQAIQATGDTTVFGNWTLELELPGAFGLGGIEIQDITDEVNSNIQGRISAVSTRLMWEQEIEEFEVDIDPKFQYSDVSMMGYAWKPFDLNVDPGSHTSGGVSNAMKPFNLQAKVFPKRRNDTGIPNSSPIALYKPIYKVQLNKVTKIYLTASDNEDDLIQCRMGRFVEIEGIGVMPNTTISQDCIVTIAAMESNGFSDDSWGVVGVVLEDFNRFPIQREAEPLPAYYASGLSASMLDFTVWVVANLTVPEFVSPTPPSQHVYTVYAGSSLVIPMAAKPSDKSLPSTYIKTFELQSLPDHFFTNPSPQTDSTRLADRVKTSNLEWRTEDKDAGNFLVQVVAIDSEGFESLDKSYKIHVSVLPQDLGQKTDANPYFPFFPQAGTVTCDLHATCSVPIFASPGTSGHVIQSIQIVNADTGIPNVIAGPVENVLYRHVHTYRSDVHFTASDVGDKAVCFLATDDHGLNTKKCSNVILIPPNYCDAQPCHITATCLSEMAGFKCVCPSDRTGTLCETWINPCLSSTTPCLHGGQCVAAGGAYACNCAGTGFTGGVCQTEIDECVSKPCHNGGNCVDEIPSFRCECVNGYSDTLCNTPPTPTSPCGQKHCDSSSVCVTAAATATCQCPLGMTGSTCSVQAPTGISLTTPQGSNTVHSVLPTLIPGSEITCAMGSTCTVPVYVPGNAGSPLRVVQGMTSPNLKTSVTPLTTDHLTGLPNTLTSSLSVSPKGPGRHSACIEIEDSSSGGATEEICYTINTPDPATRGTMSAPQLPAGKRFTDETPPDGSVINCLKSIPCHIMPHTEVTQPGGTCDSVTTRTEGAYVLGTNNCATDIVLDPTNIPTHRVCIAVGDSGEKRCYTVNTIDDTNSGSNPCKTNPCQHSGVCMVDTSANGYTCVCHVPYSGDTCNNVDTCSADRCQNQAVCENNADPTTGFQCHCQSGYGPPDSDCGHESAGCSTKQCLNGAMCVEDGGLPVCKCPLGTGGTAGTCQDAVTPPLREPVVAANTPHAVVPSLGAGSTITCDVGHTCPLPVYMTGNPSTPPIVSTGSTMPGITADVTKPQPAKVPSGALSSTLSVTPTSSGRHHVCVEIREHATSPAESVCYNIESPAGSSVSTTPGTSTTTGGGHFAVGTPPDGSEVRCREGTPCQLIVRTQKPPSGNCDEVLTQSIGVLTFATTELDDSTCGTDVLIDPGNSHACVQVGTDGEKRCFDVTSVKPTDDPCQSNPCQSGGACVPDSSKGVHGFSCNCPVPFGGPTCNTKEDCNTGRCHFQAVCSDLPTGGFRCDCQAGYEGDDCRKVPDVCGGVQCRHGAVCVEDGVNFKCQCPLGTEGETCNTDNTAIPVNPNKDQTRPHAVVPSLGSGHVIKCSLNERCSVPIFLTSSGGSPSVTTGPTSPKLVADVTNPVAAVTPHDTLTSTLSVTPKETGHHSVCVDIADNGGTADTVCYTVDVQGPAAATASPPTGGRFATGTPPDGSSVTCRDDTPCHVLALTHKPTTAGGHCPEVRAQDVGVFAYPLSDVDANTCATDVLIDPTQLDPGNPHQACMQVGVGGERRCYKINTVSSVVDPCKPSPCVNGGHCIPDGSGSHTCACPVPYNTPNCHTVDQCDAGRCVNQAACQDKPNPAQGFTCQCQPGYAAPDCRHVPAGCDALSCPTGALCVKENGGAVCKCPLGTSGTLCDHDDKDVPVNHQVDKNKPHVVVPSSGNGFQIDCHVGQTCPIPLFVHKPPGLSSSTPLEVTPGLATPGIRGSISPPGPTSVLPDTVTSTLSVTPDTPGTHHICANVKNGAIVDTVCYTVHSTPSGTGQTAVLPPGGQFSGVTPPNGARIPCRDDTPCHVIAQTSQPCTEVKTQSVGVYSLSTSIDVTTCNTDVMLDPKHVTGGQACIQVGNDGEKRCYTVDTINHLTDPCDPTSTQPAGCQHGGQCVNVNTAPNGFKCVCPPFYEGQRCQTDKTDSPINPHALMSKPHAIVPSPVNGLVIPCALGSTCSIPIVVSSGGYVETGPHDSHIDTHTPPLQPASLPPNSHKTALTVTPTTAGIHHVCVNIKDHNAVGLVVDSVCYTVDSTGPAPTPSPPAGGGRFTDETIPNGSTVNCRAGVPCQVVVSTAKPSPTQPCPSVQPDNAGASPFSAVTSPSDPGTCHSLVLIDPAHLPSDHRVCLTATVSPTSGGETRCYNVQTVTDADDVCTTGQPCVNGGRCLLVNAALDPAHSHCVCDPILGGDFCERLATASPAPDPTTTDSGSGFESTSPDGLGTSSESSPGTTSGADPCDPTSTQPAGCQNGGQCVNVNTAPNGFKCVCPPFYEGQRCQTDKTDSPINPHALMSKPHAIVPSPVNGLVIPCALGSTCSIPIVVSSGGYVETGPHDSHIDTHTPPLQPASLPPNSHKTALTVTPTTAGIHHVCVNIKDHNAAGLVVDNVCYTVDSTGPAPTPSPPAGGGRFTDETIPNGSTVNCRAGVPCQVVVSTAKPSPTQPCPSVQPDNAGASPFSAVTSPSDPGTCHSLVLIDPAHLPPGHRVCLTATVSPTSGGETRCYNVQTVTDADDVCTTGQPCVNGGRCLLVNAALDPAHSHCVCDPILGGDFCERLATASPAPDPPTTDSDSGFESTSPDGLGTSSESSPGTTSGGVTLTPVNTGGDPNKPHVVAPTPGNGFEVRCVLHQSCAVPIFTSSQGPHSCVPGPHSADIIVSCLPLESPHGTPSAVPPGTHMAPLVIVAQTAGRYHACLDIKRGSDSAITDTVCYVVNAVTAPTGTGTSGSGPRFTTGTPPDGSRLVCEEGRPCQLVVTQPQPCNDVVQSTPPGVTATPLFADQCSTLVNVDTSQHPAPSQACVSLGAGENRCYPVTIVPAANNLCARQPPCLHGGVCMNMPSQSPTFQCVCRDPSVNCQPIQPNAVQCRAEEEALRRAAKAGRVHCTCRHPVTNVTYDVIRPRVSNERLLRAGFISSGVTVGLMTLVAVLYFLVRTIKAKVAAYPSSGGRRGFEGREYVAWPEEKGGNARR